MSEQERQRELEQALRRALRPADPGEDFADRVVARLDASAAQAAPAAMPVVRQSRGRSAARWLPMALAACAIAAVGLGHWRHEALQRQRGLQARAQLLQALRIASANVNAVRAAVIDEEQPLP
ncbi:MAG TPA: hypothetical protein VHX52_12155 [Steroidobacteraceae bacterium]|nr:hypothetical protein [Steroidobacteraceae bacterium]